MAYNSFVGENVVKTALDEVFFTEFAYEAQPGFASAETDAIFKQRTVDRAAVITEQLSGLGYWDEKTELGTISSASPQVTNQKVFNVVEYAKQLPLSRNMLNDDQHSTVAELVQDFARTGRLTRDRNAFAVFRNGFTTELTNDGVALFSASHVTISGTTVSNTSTAVLSEPNLLTGINSLRAQITQDGTLGGHRASVLLVPPALFKTAMEVTKSELRSGTANNDFNYYSMVYPGLMVYSSDFLSAAEGGSDTAWYLLSSTHSIYRWVREGVQTVYVPWENQPNNEAIYKAMFREVVGAVTWEGAWGSTGV